VSNPQLLDEQPGSPVVAERWLLPRRGMTLLGRVFVTKRIFWKICFLLDSVIPFGNCENQGCFVYKATDDTGLAIKEV